MRRRRVSEDEERNRVAGLTANRQREFKQRRVASGMRRVAVWVPEGCIQELREIAARMRGATEVVSSKKRGFKMPAQSLDETEPQTTPAMVGQTREQVLKALSREVGESVAAIREEYGPELNEAIERWAVQRNIRIID